MLVFVEAIREHERAFSLSEHSEDRDAVVIGEEEDAVDIALREVSVRWVSGSSEEIDVTVVDVVDVALREELVRWVSGNSEEIDSEEHDVVTVVVVVVEENPHVEVGITGKRWHCVDVGGEIDVRVGV